MSLSILPRGLMDEQSSQARIHLNHGIDAQQVQEEEQARMKTLRSLAALKKAHMATPGEKSRPATMSDVIIDRGEFLGDGVPRTAGWHPYEPLDWHGTEVLA